MLIHSVGYHLSFISWHNEVLFSSPCPLSDLFLGGLRAEDQLLHQRAQRLSVPDPGLPDLFPRVPQALAGLAGRYQTGAALHVRNRVHGDLRRGPQIHIRERARQGGHQLQVAGR